MIAGTDFVETEDFFTRLGPFLQRRSAKLWASMTRRAGAPPEPPRIVPDVEVADRLAFDQGSTRFEVIKVPGATSPCCSKRST